MRAAAIELLRRNVLRNIVPLKMLALYGDAVIPTVAGESVLLLLPTQVSTWDRKAYPDSDWIVLPMVNQARDWPAMLQSLPRNGHFIFKLAGDDDALALSNIMNLTRVTAFHSYTGCNTPGDETVLRLADLPVTAEPLFAAQGYPADEVRGYIREHDGRVFILQHEGRVAAACFAQRNFAQVHEVGGVFTVPQFRRLGLARRLVGAAVADVCARGLAPRYQFHEGNQASQALAESAGLTRFLTMTHYRAVGPV